MIGSFWNLCRACPSMPVDKLHSEYRSTYRWHEYTGARPDVVRRAPIPNNFGRNGMDKIQPTRSTEDDAHIEDFSGSKVEPALPRRKKHPELAYRTHDVIGDGHINAGDITDATAPADRARSEGRSGFPGSRPARRSKSEGPPGIIGASPPPRRPPPTRSDSDPINEDTMATHHEETNSRQGHAAHGGGLFSKAINHISTEYRLQFAWPQGRRSGKGAGKESAPPRKSLSMGAIRPVGNGVGPAGVHKRRTDFDVSREGNTHELEPLVNENDSTEKAFLKAEIVMQRKDFKTEYKKKFRPFSQYEYLETEGRFTQRQKEKGNRGPPEEPTLPLLEPDVATVDTNSDSWYREVIELRKKAGEYKSRGWGTDLTPGHNNEHLCKQMELWEQVSRRSSLSALSLASTTHRSISKEEKDKENNKKASPTKASGMRNARIPLTARSGIDNKAFDSTRLRKETIRHHLERTTGIECTEDGALLPSPTREKLVPVSPRNKDDDCSPKRGSPQKGSSQKGSPQKGSPKKGSPQKGSVQKIATKSSPRSGRSQSVGPVTYNESLSPKRSRPGSTVVATTPTAKQKKSPTVNPTPDTERRPRPTTLSTTVPHRSKSSTVPHKSSSIQITDKVRKSKPTLNLSSKSVINGSTIDSALRPKGEKQTKFETDGEGVPVKHTHSISSTAGRSLTPVMPEHVVKSPPEPTRVKSPEQIIMRSPDPVNWTVPLDTGKTFTVTQNVRDGEIVNRPYSEVKAWTPPDAPPPAPQSAPPELAQQAKSHAWKSDHSVIGGDFSSTVNGEHGIVNPGDFLSRSAKPVLGSNLRCLDDPNFTLGPSKPNVGHKILEAPIAEVPYWASDVPDQEQCYRDIEAAQSNLLEASLSGRSLASDVLEKARTRFDKFWGNNSKDGSV